MKLKLLFVLSLLLFSLFDTVMADWIRMNGQSTGSANVIEVYDGKIYIGTKTSVLRSDDGGVNWVTLTTGMPNLDVTSITFQNEFIFIGTVNNGIYRSANLGNTWVSVSNEMGNPHIMSIVSKGNNLIAGTLELGIFVSTNYGDNWTQQNSGLLNLSVHSVYSSGDKIYATTAQGGVYVSDISQICWLPINTGLLLDFTVRSITKSGTNLVIGTEMGIFYSYDHGTHWVAGNTGITTNDVFVLKSYEDRIFAGTNDGGLYRSLDNGVSWESITMDNTVFNVLCIGLYNNQLLVSFNYGDLFSSSDWGDNWISIHQSSIELINPKIRRFLLSDEKLFVACYGGYVYLSTTFGETWQDISEGVECTNAHDFAEVDSFVFVATDNGIYRTNKNIINWVKVSNFYSGSFFVRGKNIYHATNYQGVYFSTDYGQTWENKGLGNELIMTFEGNEDYIYVGTEDECFYSKDNGNTWINAGYFSSWISQMTIKDNYIYAVTYYHGIKRSQLGSSEWTQVAPNYNWPPVLMIEQYKEYILLGTKDFGMFITNNNGETFSQLNNGFPIFTTANAFAYNNSYLFAGIWGGVYRQDVVPNLMNLVGVEENEEGIIATDFILNQNFPNPFNPSTTISFNLPTSVNVSLKIYDAVGKEVATLINEEMPAGYHQKQWNAVDFSSGVYFYRLQAGNYSATKKLTLVK